MSLLSDIRSKSLRPTEIKHDTSAPVLNSNYDAPSHTNDVTVLHCNIENWYNLLDHNDITYRSLFIPLSQSHSKLLIHAYEDTEQRPEAVKAAAEAYSRTRMAADIPPLSIHEATLRTSLGPQIQAALSSLSDTTSPGCFVKLSSRSPKDAFPLSGAFASFYRSALLQTPSVLSDPNSKLKILIEAEREGLRFEREVDVIRALVLSERVWQDLTIALRHPTIWQQNIIIRAWEPIDVDMEFRMFIHASTLTAISQYAYQLHSSRLLPSRFRKALTKCLCEFYERELRGSLESGGGFEDCVIDVGVRAVGDGRDGEGSEESNSPIHFRPKVIEINPFLPTTDGALFSWETERDLLEGTRRDAGVVYPVLRVNEKVRSGALVMVPKGWRDVIEIVDREVSDGHKRSDS